MKLSKEVQDHLMKDHRERLDGQAHKLLDVPMIRSSVAQHSKKNGGFVKTEATSKVKETA